MTDSRRLDLPAVADDDGPAPDYLRVARPTPAVAALALEALRRTGIAARVSGSPPADAAGRRELWVDARELDDALTVLAAVVRHAGLSADDLGRVGEETVLDDLGAPERTGERPGPGGDTHRPGPTRNPTPSARPYPTPSRPAGPPPPERDVPPTARTGPDPDAVDHSDDHPDDHFRPDEPESLRTLSRTTVWALAILAVGVLALALSGLLPRLVGVYAPLTSLLGTAAVLVGVGMLVTRLRDGRPDDDDHGGPNGDGAVL